MAIVVMVMNYDDKSSEQWVIVSPDGTKLPNPRSITSGYPTGVKLDSGEIEQKIIKYTNEARASAGMSPPLVHDDRIAAIARAHSKDMTEKGLRHVINGKDPTGRALAAGYDCKAYTSPTSYTYGLSENIAEHPRVVLWRGRGSSWHPVNYYWTSGTLAQAVVEQWMNSPGHRENILDEGARRIGVGVVITEGSKGDWISETVWVTQNFSNCE